MCGRGIARLGAGLILAALAAWASCTYSPNPTSGQLICGANNACPKGYSCIDNACWKDGQTPGGPGGSGGSGGAGLDAFIGRWSFTSGTIMVACTDGTSDNKPLRGEYMVVDEGADGDLTASFYCDWEVNVPPGTSSTVLIPGQTCMSTSGGTTFTWRGTSFNFSTRNGAMATLMSNISATFKDPVDGGVVEGSCTLVINGALTKDP